MSPEEVEYNFTAESLFVDKLWLDNALRSALEGFNGMDANSRISPMAVVRCSRGGKSRALKELTVALKNELGHKSAVIYICLNDSTYLRQWEQDDPITSICRRLAFASRVVNPEDTRPELHQFMDF